MLIFIKLESFAVFEFNFHLILKRKTLENLVELNLSYSCIESEDLKIIGDNCCFLKRLNMSNLNVSIFSGI